MTNTFRIEGWYNPSSKVSRNVLLNLISTALLRAVSNRPKARITAAAALYREGQFSRPAKRQRERLSSMTVIILFWSLVASSVLGLTVSTMVTFPVAEILSGARELQLMTGVSGPLYVTSHFLFDLFVQYLLPFGASFATYCFWFSSLAAVHDR
ncbi:hypothetical protein MTO96_026885 [Rhipicephalus appendiculatus]